MLPGIKLTEFSRDPGVTRSLLSKLSKVVNIGVIEYYEVPGFLSFRAFADRHSFTVVQDKKSVFVTENIGAKTVRNWQEDDIRDVKNVSDMLIENFGECHADIPHLVYLYTEHSAFIWREHHQSHLPKIKRRVYLFPDGSTCVLHSRQNDSNDGDIMEYYLETSNQNWLMSYRVTANEKGELEGHDLEAAHKVEQIGF